MSSFTHADRAPNDAAQPSRRLLLAVALPTLLSVAAAGALVTCPSSWARAAAVPAVELSTAFARFQQAGADNPDAVDDAARRFEQLSAADPTDPVLRAYAGASTARRAKTTWMPWRKMSLAEDGLALIDKALAQLTPAHDAPLHRGVPAVLETRFVAASTFLSLPSMFNRGERGRKELDAVLNSPLLDAAPAPFRATVWLRAAQLAEDEGQTARQRQWLDKVAASGAPQAEAARQRLKGL
jgi:hypothetical protein